MAEQDNEEELLAAAKVAILKRIPRIADNSTAPQVAALYLAMAYVTLDRYKLPGEIPTNS